MVCNILGTIFIGICSVTDIISKKIYLSICIVFLCIGILIKVLMYRESAGYLMLSVIPGLIMLFVGFVSREKVGYGDGSAMMVTGIIYGINATLNICIYAFLTLLLYCIIMLILRKKQWNDEIPFLPFLMVGNIILFINGGAL